jgi:hypothetical protein
MRKIRMYLKFHLMATIAIGCVTSKASDFTFTRIAHYNAGEIGSLIGNASINNNGEVIFGVYLPSGDEVIYIGDGSSLIPLIDTSGPIDSFFYHSRLNDSGQFAYRAIMDDGSQSLFRHSSSGEELIRSTTLGSFSAIPSINTSGDVAYIAREDDVSPNYLYRWNGSEELILDTTGTYSSLGGWPSIADNGDIVINAQLSEGGDNLIIANSTSTEVILDGSGIFEGSAMPSISNNGAISFLGHLNSNNNSAIGRYYQNNIDLIFGDPDNEHPDIHINNFPGINDRGVVAFQAGIFSEGVTQAYIYDDELIPVLRTGDLLDGRIVAGMGLQGDGCINNYGHLALTIKFDDGSWGVYRAVPEPCTILLLAAGGLLLRRKRKL